MSSRVTKRAAGGRPEEPAASKRRRADPEDALWQIRSVSDLKMSSIYNRSASEAPAELFRKDLISAMKLPDSEPLTSNEYWVITDTWKQDWERGVQVPVNPDSLPAPVVKIIDNPLPPNFQEFKLPKDKYIHLNRDAYYQADQHHLSTIPARAESCCTYDLDATDSAWLKLLNAERARAGAPAITEDQLERVLEELEVRCWDKIQAIMKSEEKLGIEYDENVICDVCRSPDSEEGNEMVFCDSCNICVHQACYGITTIPSGQWLCRPCSVTRHNGTRPTCVLCPNLGGAMKCTPSGHKWAHVSCVLWIPEVSIGCAEKMEPITKISGIPASRWSLVCVLCRERKGACIQCSVKTCKTAYHVTCAFKHGLEMRAIIEDENADDGVKLRSYCQKHSVNSKKDKCPGSGSEDDEVKRKRRKDMTSEEKNQARAAKLQEIESEFDRHVSVKDISTHLLDVDQDAIYYIYNYWKLKRRSGYNRPLLPPKADDSDILSHRQEQADLDKMKMFVQLRQDLERVRNLCYMVSRREKLSRSFFRMREQTFHKQLAVLSNASDLSGPTISAVVEANHGPSIYDRLYSHPDAAEHTEQEFEAILSRIAGFSESCDDKKKDMNGLLKSNKSSVNPYKKVYVNGSSRRSGSMYSGLSSEESASEIHRSTKYRNRTLGSSTDDDSKTSTSPKKKVSPITKEKCRKTDRKKRIAPSRSVIDSSSEEDIKPSIVKDKSRSNTLRQMEKEMTAGQSETESDDLMPVGRLSNNKKFTVDIYSDSSENSEMNKTEDFSIDKSPNATNDSQQPLPRTKAAMKEFVPIEKNTREDPVGKKRGRKPSTFKEKSHGSDNDVKDKENSKSSKTKDYRSDLIVPQRQAAKKASENMRSNTKSKDSAEQVDKPAISLDESKTKVKSKHKVRDSKDHKDKESPIKETSKKKVSGDMCDLEKDEKDPEPIAYVPQRQAAKKAAAHIKSGLGSKFSVTETSDESKKKEIDKVDSITKSPRKDEEKSAKTSSKSSSSSSSNSSSSSYSSSSSSEDENKSDDKVAKSREMKPQTAKQTTLFSPQRSRPTVDLPFLDKVSRPLSSTSASSDSDSSKDSKESGSSSPTPKRIRPRRKETCGVSDASRKAPDKKLKTSERRSECGHPTPSAQGEEPVGSGAARSATRARTRSTTTGGNMPNKCESQQRKSSKDEQNSSSAKAKTLKENAEPSELPPKERKEDKTLNRICKHESPKKELTEVKPINKANKLSSDKRQSNETEKSKASPLKHSDVKYKPSSETRLSVKEAISMDSTDLVSSENNSSKLNIYTPAFSKDSSPVKIPNVEKTYNLEEKFPPARVVDDLSDTAKHWFPKAPSPTVTLPPVEKPGGNDKYITEDKSFDSDSADKSSVKMIAKIQATLNENTMIKSPKTPMDARTIISEPIDVDMPMARNVRKRSAVDPDKKFITQDASHVQGVEISKSAKIPSAVNSFANRCIFSPQPKDNELFEFDMLSVEDGFNHEEIIKPFTYPELFFKEDSKEDRGVQETLNLVEKLRMTLSSKKPPQVENTITEEPLNHNDNTPSHIEVKSLQNNTDLGATASKIISSDFVENTNEGSTLNLSLNHISRHTPEIDVMNDSNPETRSLTSQAANTNKWSEMPISDNSRINDDKHIRKEYNIDMGYDEDSMKNTGMPSVEIPPVSEMDHDNLSKHSDDDSQCLSVVDHSLNSNDQDSMDNDHQNYENNNSVIHSECATMSSPYIEGHETKWRESKITRRRSSSSSNDSDGSISSQKSEMKSQIESSDPRQPNAMPEMEVYPSIPQYCPMEPLPLSQYNAYPPDPSQYLSTMSPISIFPPGTCGSSQIPLPSPGVGLFPPDIPYNASPLIPPITPLAPKPVFPILSAAFTSSSQNIALTTAMIAPPTPKPIEQSPRDDIDIGSDKYPMHHTPSPTVSVDSYNELSTSRQSMPKHGENNETVASHQASEAKSPPKPFKTVTKLMQQVKSPGKSPGISPKQTKDSVTNKRSTTKSTRAQRGRGRSKTRGHGYSSGNIDYLENSIQSKLVGTVYDFNDELANDDVDLKALRERRKSIDVQEKKSENSFKDSSQSPLNVQPHNKRMPTSSDSKESKTPTSVTDIPETSTSPPSKSATENQNFVPVVQPVLPGPVDMRTYQSFETATTTSEPYHSHLLAFASGTADQQLADIDEEFEKQLHNALAASKPATSPKNVNNDSTQATNKSALLDKGPAEIPLPKVSLSDSRNQLKVKIKGPFLDANYSNTSAQPAAPQPPAATLEPTPSMMGTPSAVGSSSMMSGTTNLRRMRKKELLRQYWTQDMNMDEPTANPSLGNAPPPASQPLLPRAVITIPKAVASMTSIPTREDYRGVTESNIEKKKRRTTSGLSRELRHLEVSMNDDVDTAEEARLSSYTNTAGQTYSQKRRGRISNKPIKPPVNTPLAPKLKIKIGSSFVQPVNVGEPSGFQFRPPKKRLASIHKPTFEDLRRESMKYRRMVMAHFEEDEETKKHKPKGEKRKKKKDKKVEKLRVVNSDNERATKLVIKIKRTKNEMSTVSKKASDGEGVTGGGAGRSECGGRSVGGSGVGSAAGRTAALALSADPFEYDPTAPDPLAIDPPSCEHGESSSSLRKVRTAKVTPIRLKLARSAEGSGYVMKESGGQASSSAAPAAPAAPAARALPTTEVR